MSQILLRCRIKTRRDISKGLFVCALVLEVSKREKNYLKFPDALKTSVSSRKNYFQYTLMSKRLAPSAINFLRGVIYLATPKPPPLLHKVIPPFKHHGDASNLLILEADQKSITIACESACMRAGDLSQTEFDDEFKIRAFVTAINMISEFKKQYEELEAAYVIFEPIIKLLKMNAYESYPKSVKKHARSVRKDLQSLADKKLEYIVREKKKPKALRLYEPRIEKV